MDVRGIERVHHRAAWGEVAVVATWSPGRGATEVAAPAGTPVWAWVVKLRASDAGGVWVATVS